MGHFQTNTGTTKNIAVKEMIDQDRVAYKRFRNDLNDALSFVETAKPPSLLTIGTPEWINELQGGDKDWGNTLNDYRTAARGTHIGCRASVFGTQWQMQFEYRVRDVYYWELGKHEGFYTLTHDELARMHRYGRMKYFESDGL